MKGKLLLTAMIATALVGSSAYASIARMAVMGTQPTFTAPGTTGAGITTNTVNGSLWYDDEYNVFYNPSYINDSKNYVTVEKGIEGGFFKGEMENFAYGVYFNRGGTNASATAGSAPTSGANSLSQAGTVAPGMAARTQFLGPATAASAGGPILSTQRPVDVFFGGDTGVKWGVHVAWAYNRDQTVASATSTSDEVTARYWHVDAGIQIMGLEPFVGTTFSSKIQSQIAAVGGANGTATNEGNQNLNEFTVGTRYKYESWTPYVVFHKYREDGTPIAATTNQVGTRFNVIGGGIGHDTKVADGVHVYKHVGFFYTSGLDDTIATTTDFGREWKEYVLPLNVALEADATSWLTLRAGAAFNLWDELKFARIQRLSAPGATDTSATDKKKSNLGNLTFRVGSTLKFGKLHIDSAFGNGTVAAASNLDTANVGFDSQTFALLSASYHW